MASLSHGAAVAVAGWLAACSGGRSSPPPPSETAPVVAVGTDAAVDADPVRPGWVDIATRIPDAVLDMRYATSRNFTGQQLYPRARCLLRTAVAERLAAAADALRAQGHRLLLWDCYRPASIQRELWRLVPDPRFVAKPVFGDAGQLIDGSNHSRGAAVDLSLTDAAGVPRAMPTDHDAFGPAASGSSATGDAARNHAILRAAMIAAGFEIWPDEWWHFDAGDWSSYALSDDPL